MQSPTLAVALSALAVSATLSMSGCSQSTGAPTLSMDPVPAPPVVIVESDSHLEDAELRTPDPAENEDEKIAPAQLEEAFAGELVELVANLELGARLGRVVASYPEGARVVRYFGDSFPPYSVTAEGSVEPVAQGGGTLSKVLLPGSYVVSLLGNKTLQIEVVGGHDTLIRAGALRVAVPDGTAWTLFDDEGNQLYRYQRLSSWYRNPDVGLLPGRYVVEIGGGRVEVDVSADQITEF